MGDQGLNLEADFPEHIARVRKIAWAIDEICALPFRSVRITDSTAENIISVFFYEGEIVSGAPDLDDGRYGKPIHLRGWKKENKEDDIYYKRWRPGSVDYELIANQVLAVCFEMFGEDELTIEVISDSLDTSMSIREGCGCLFFAPVLASLPISTGGEFARQGQAFNFIAAFITTFTTLGIVAFFIQLVIPNFRNLTGLGILLAPLTFSVSFTMYDSVGDPEIWGVVLWFAVFVALYFAWSSERKGNHREKDEIKEENEQKKLAGYMRTQSEMLKMAEKLADFFRHNYQVQSCTRCHESLMKFFNLSPQGNSLQYVCCGCDKKNRAQPFSSKAREFSVSALEEAEEVLGKGLIKSIYFSTPDATMPYEQTARISLPESIRSEVWRRDMGQCTSCGTKQNLEFDHIIPVSEGGANSVRNLQLLCRSCNARKSNKI